MKCNILYFIVLLFFISACSSVPIKPLPESQRIPIIIHPFNDLTGQYQLFRPSFDSLCSLIFAPGLIEVLDPCNSRTSNNRNLMLYQNPIRILHSDDKIIPKYQLTGDIELISYGSAEQMESVISAYAIFGLVGLSLISNQDMAACVQYRICLRDSQGVVLDKILVVGVSSGNPKEKSRIELTFEANSVAACSFQSQLLESLSKQGYNLNRKAITLLFDPIELSNRQAFNKCIEIVNNLLRPNQQLKLTE